MLSATRFASYEGCATTLSDFRRIALSMPQTEELNGMGYPNFRTARKSFAIIEDTTVVIRLTPDQQAIFVATAPEVFARDSSGWGRLGNTVMRLEMADEATVKVAIATAWRNVAEVGEASESVEVDVAGVESANEFVSVAEIIEEGSAAKVAAVGMGNAGEVDATLANVAGEVTDEVNAAGISAAEVPNEAAVVPAEEGAVTVEPREHLLSGGQQTIAGDHGERSMAFTLLGGEKREHDRFKIWRGF